MKTRTIQVTISETAFELLGVIARGDQFCGIGTVKAVVHELIDHAQQGVYRPGAWERGWLTQAFGDDWINYLEPGDPHGRPGCEHIFQRPRAEVRK